MGVGAVSAYTIAFSLLQIPLGVIGDPARDRHLPALARELAVGRTSHYLEILIRSLRIVAFVMLPITALGMVLRVQIVELLLGYGKFDQAAVLTADTLLLFLIGLTAQSSIAVLTRAFYARQDTRTPTLAAVLARRDQLHLRDRAGRVARAARDRARDRSRGLERGRDAAADPATAGGCGVQSRSLRLGRPPHPRRGGRRRCRRVRRGPAHGRPDADRR